MNFINCIDSLLGIVDLVEAALRFSQREDVRHYAKHGINIGQAILLCLGALAIILLWFAITSVRATYRHWQAVLPAAVAAFKEGYRNSP